jgi:hypothetical protein
MKNIKTFEGFVSNVKDAIKKKDVYHLFKGSDREQTFGDRSKIDAATLKELVRISEEELGLKTEKYGKSTWAWKDGNDKMEWNYDGEHIYFKPAYEKYIRKQ